MSPQLFGVNKMLYYRAANPSDRWGRPRAMDATATFSFREITERAFGCRPILKVWQILPCAQNVYEGMNVRWILAEGADVRAVCVRVC